MLGSINIQEEVFQQVHFLKIIQISAISGFYVYLLPCGKSERNDQNDDEKIKSIVYMPIIYSVVHLCHAPLYACY